MWEIACVTAITGIVGFCFALYAVFAILTSICWSGLSTLIVKRRKRPALLDDDKFGIHKFITLPKQGITLHYVENGDPSKKLVLFLHGFPEFWFSWRHQLVELSKNYRTIALDLRGYGESGKPAKTKDYVLEHAIDDVAEFIQCHGGNCVLVTIDMGSMVGWELAQKYPHLVEKHVAINGPTNTALISLIGRNIKQTLWSSYAIFFLLPYLPEIFLRLNDMALFAKLLKKSTNEEIECYKYMYSQPGGFTCPLNWYRSLSDHRPNTAPREPVPTLVIWGLKCIAITKVVPEKLSKLGDHVNVIYLQNAGQYLQLEEFEVVNKLIEKFVENEPINIVIQNTDIQPSQQ